MTAIDKVDSKIVGLLFEDSRRNFAEIAKEVGISKNAAWSRYKKLCRMGVITGATVQINYKKLGYDAVAGLLLEVELPNLGEVSRFISTRVPDVFGPFVSPTMYNLRAVVTLKTIRELGQLKEELRRLPGVTGVNSSIWTDVWFTPENLSLLPIRPIKSVDETNDRSIFSADHIDLEIIRTLAQNSRLPFRAIAKQLEISTDTVARRYEKLVKEHIIVSRIQIDPQQIGYAAQVNLYINVKPSYEVDDIIRKVTSIENVHYTMKSSGEYNMGVMFMIRNVQDLLSMGDNIAQIPGTRRIETVTSRFHRKWPLPRTYTSTLNRL